MAAALSAISTAVSVGSTAASSITNPTSTTSKCCGYTHWSFYVVVAGAAAALITGIVLAVLAQIPVAVVCGVLVATQIIAAYYIKILAPYKAMAEITNQFGDIVKGTTQNQKEIQQANQAIQQANQSTIQSTQQISKTVDETSKVISQGDALSKESERILKEAQDRQAANTKALEATIADLKGKLKDADGNLAKQTQASTDLQTQIDGLHATIQQYVNIQEQITADTKALREMTDPPEHRKQKNKDLKQQGAKMMEKLKECTPCPCVHDSTPSVDTRALDQSLANLTVNTTRLDASAQQMSTSVQALGDQNKELHSSVTTIQATIAREEEVNNNLNALVAALTQIKQDAGKSPPVSPKGLKQDSN